MSEPLKQKLNNRLIGNMHGGPNMTNVTQNSTELRYRITLMVTAHQEFAIQSLFSLNGWAFSKVIEFPKLAGGSEVSGITIKNEPAPLSSICLSLPEISQPALLTIPNNSLNNPPNALTNQAKNTGLQAPQLTKPFENSLFPVELSKVQDKLDEQMSDDKIEGNEPYLEVKKEVSDSDTEIEDEAEIERNIAEIMKLPDIQIAMQNELVDKSIPQNEESSNKDVLNTSSQSKNIGNIKEPVKNITAVVPKKKKNRNRKSKTIVPKVLYEDGDTVRNEVDGQIDAMSLILRKEDALVCCMCKGSFPDEDKFKEHASVCLKSLFELKGSHVHKCNDCQAYFRQAYTLLRHKQYELCTGDDKTRKMLTCKYCGKTYSTKRRTEFILHYQTHNNDRPYECEVCNRKFNRWQSLKNHKRRHTGEKPFKCRHCDKMFASMAGKRSHEKGIHEGLPKSFVCDKCGAAFKMGFSLRLHIKEVHEMSVIYTCEVCKKQFNRRSSLIMHRDTHSTVRDKVCEICGKGFHRQSYLTHHMKRHNNERSFFCDLCNKGFYSKKNLAEHRSTHTGNKAYSCLLCNYQCAYYSNTIKHIRLKHPNVTDLKTVICKNGETKAIATE